MNISLSESLRQKAKERRLAKKEASMKTQAKWMKDRQLAYDAMELCIKTGENPTDKNRYAAVQADIRLLKAKAVTKEAKERAGKTIELIQNGNRKYHGTARNFWGLYENDGVTASD